MPTRQLKASYVIGSSRILAQLNVPTMVCLMEGCDQLEALLDKPAGSE